MKLKEALKRVIKICPKSKDQALFKAVRFVAGKDGQLSKVFTSDGVCMSLIPVDDILPDMLVNSTEIINAIKDAGDLELTIDQGLISLVGNRAIYRLVASDNVNYFPQVPIIPKHFSEFHFSMAKKVIHAAPIEKDNSIPVIHFNDRFIEAFDSIRLARVEVNTLGDRFVPANIFKSWPVGTVEIAYTSHFTFFRIGEEIRIANNLLSVTYPDTNKLIAKHNSGSYFVDTEEILQVVRQATEISPINLVLVTVVENKAQIKACNAKGPIPNFECFIPIKHKWENPGEATVDGKLFLQALKECDTPTVKLTVGENIDPLRIESGYFTECIWQRYWG